MAEKIGFKTISEIQATDVAALQPPAQVQLKAPKTGSYSRCYITYPTGEEFLFELSGKITCYLDQKTAEDGTLSYQLKMDLSNPIDQKGFSEIYKGLSAVVHKYKGAFGQPMFNPANPHGVLKNPMFSPMDKNTGELIQGAKPIVWAKIDAKSNFTKVVPKRDRNGNLTRDYDLLPVDYKNLAGKQVKASVILHLSDIYKGSTISPQVKIRSCAILEVTNSGYVDHRQSSVLSSLMNDDLDPEYLETLAKDMDKLKTVESILPPGLPTVTQLPQLEVPLDISGYLQPSN